MVILELFFDPVVELFLRSFFRGQDGLLTEAKNQLFLGVILGVKNRLFWGSKMTPKSAQKLRPKMRKNAQNGQNRAQTHWD